jgi:hypothetical protein
LGRVFGSQHTHRPVFGSQAEDWQAGLTAGPHSPGVGSGVGVGVGAPQSMTKDCVHVWKVSPSPRGCVSVWAVPQLEPTSLQLLTVTTEVDGSFNPSPSKSQKQLPPLITFIRWHCVPGQQV